MPKRIGSKLRVLAGLCLMAWLAGPALAQDEEQLTANRRLLPGIGAGLRAVKLGVNGRTYVLASPSPGLVVFDMQGKQVLAIEGVAAVIEQATAALPVLGGHGRVWARPLYV